MKFLAIIAKNVRRNPLRTALTSLSTIVLVFVVTLVWAVLSFLDQQTQEKATNLKAIVSERWQIPSQMPFAYAAPLAEAGARNPDDVRPMDHMTWQFFGGMLDAKGRRTPDNFVFGFAMEPKKINTMMDDLDNLTGPAAAELAENIKKLEQNKRGLIIGKERLAAINKRVGERITIHGLIYKGIDLEFEIIGVCPEGRYNQMAFFNRDYLNDTLEAYPRTHNGQKHAMAERTLNLVWIRLPDQKSFSRAAEQVMSSPSFSNPAVKCETASSGVSAFLESYRDLIWGMRWLLAPAILVTLSLVIANAISISVRERRLEMAVMKVLGFQPGHILGLVLGEAILIGVGSGVFSAAATYFVVNEWMGGIKFPIAFFPAFFIPKAAIYWGFLVGGGAAFAGSILPALSARNVRVSDVFAKIA